MRVGQVGRPAAQPRSDSVRSRPSSTSVLTDSPVSGRALGPARATAVGRGRPRGHALGQQVRRRRPPITSTSVPVLQSRPPDIACASPSAPRCGCPRPLPTRASGSVGQTLRSPCRANGFGSPSAGAGAHVPDDAAGVRPRLCCSRTRSDDVLELQREIGRAAGFGLGDAPVMTRQQQGCPRRG